MSLAEGVNNEKQERRKLVEVGWSTINKDAPPFDNEIGV